MVNYGIGFFDDFSQDEACAIMYQTFGSVFQESISPG